MNRLQCVGKPSEVSSKVNEKEAAPIKTASISSADLAAKESVEWKLKQLTPKPIGKTEGPRTSINSETNSPPLKAQSSKSRGYTASKAPSFTNVTTHGHKLPKQAPPVMTGKQTTYDIRVNNVHNLQIQTPEATRSKNQQNSGDAQTEVDERQDDESETAEQHVPLELFAEFLQALMSKNYQLAKKLCQMILIYEPHNSEANSFLPLIEEKILMEEEESDNDNTSDESDTSDEDSEEEEGDGSEDDEDDSDNDESSGCCDLDEESTDSTDDTLSSS